MNHKKQNSNNKSYHLTPSEKDNERMGNDVILEEFDIFPESKILSNKRELNSNDFVKSHSIQKVSSDELNDTHAKNKFNFKKELDDLLKSCSIFLKKILGSLDIKIENDSKITNDYYKSVGDDYNNFERDFNYTENDNQNVDDILSKIIPQYNQHISIEVNHVDLTFEVNNEKVDTIKESVIRRVRGDKQNKFKIHALKDISFNIYKGEKIGIIGYNGAGKSTLLKVITGIYTPDKGTVYTNGKISPLLSLGAGFDYNYSGRKNIFLNGAVLGYDKKYLESKVDEIIEFSELGDFIDIPIKNYSSGMLAKLGFSIATALEPNILIIDEILGVGDVSFQKKSRDKIRSLMDGGTTVLLVSHSIPQIRELCDKAIWVDNGELREIGEVNNVCDHYIKDSENASNDQLANIQLRA